MKTFPTCTAVYSLGLACALALAPAFAGDDEHKGHTSAAHEVSMMDTNKDGRISKSEHAMGAKKMFQKIDADYDGRVTADEMNAAHKDMSSAQSSNVGSKPMKSSADKIKAIDTDSDGVISAEEHEKGSQKMFGKLDKNEDGDLTQAEIQAGHDRMLSAEEK